MGQNIPFREVSGLETETQVTEYRKGDTNKFDVIKIPGIAKTKVVTLKKGVFVKGSKFFDWHNQIKMNTIKRESVTIKLLDETGKPTMVWKLTNAWPTKITGSDLKSEGNEIAVETLEIVYEGIAIDK